MLFLLIDVGFLLMALLPFFNLPKLLAIHAFSFGGIGVATLSMMARVSLGHTGRNVKNPPGATTIALTALIVGSLSEWRCLDNRKSLPDLDTDLSSIVDCGHF